MAERHLAEAVNAAVEDAPGCTSSLESLVVAVGQKFVEQQLDRFPWYCYEARKENLVARKALREAGNEQGWSEERTFRLDFIIPRDLYLFMINLVYKEFWAESNERVWRKFMTGVCRGDDPMDWLKALKIYYGSSRMLQAAGQL